MPLQQPHEQPQQQRRAGTTRPKVNTPPHEAPPDATTESAGNDLTVTLRNQFSLIEKGNTPLMRPSPTPNKRNTFRKATSLFVDTPNKFGGTGERTTIGGLSGYSRQSRTGQSFQIDDFIQHTQPVGQVLQSKDLRELMANITIAMKRVFKATRVNFLLQCKETIDIFRKEGGTVKQMTHAHHTFWAVVPENVRARDFEMNF